MSDTDSESERSYSESECDSDSDLESVSDSESESESRTNYFEKIKKNPKKVLSRMDYDNRIGFLNQMKLTVQYFIKNSKSTLFDALNIFLVSIILFKFPSYVPRLPIGRFIPDNTIITNMTYKGLIEKTASLAIILLIFKKLFN